MYCFLLSPLFNFHVIMLPAVHFFGISRILNQFFHTGGVWVHIVSFVSICYITPYLYLSQIAFGLPKSSAGAAYEIQFHCSVSLI